MTPVLEPIAIIGIGGRFPGAVDIETFWRNVQAGADCLAEPVPDIDALDAGHFGLTPREAEELDPQVRLFLEVTADAIEDAGYDVTAIGDGAAVFGSAAPSRYPAALPATVGMAALTSARLGLRGPSVTVGSGSLVSVHLACQSLRMGECDLAVAGGACVRLPGGTGSGAAVVVLKRLADAISDGDLVRARIVGSATAHDELSAIAEAMAMAGCEPQEIACTEVGDLAEAGALSASYRRLAAGGPGSGAERHGSFGSVAPLIGHLGSAAGIAGLVRAVLALGRERPGRAAVSFRDPGGGHAYVVLEEGIPPAVPPPVRQPRIVVWSGRDEAANHAYGDRLSNFFAGLDEERFADATATLQRGRTAHQVRSAVVCSGAAEAAEMLGSGKAIITGESPAAGSPQVVLSFPGGEALHAGMATSLYGVVPVFTETMDICLELFEQAGLDLYDLWLHGTPEPASRQAEALLFAIEHSLGRTWLDWCTAPSTLTGEGLGGLVARTVGGELELGHAVRLIMDGEESWGTHPAAPDLTDRVVVEVGPGSDLRQMLTTLAELWVRGCSVDWAAIDPDHDFRRLTLPGYPYQRSRHWAESPQPDIAEVSPGPAVEEVPGLPSSAEPLRTPGRLQHSFWMLEQLAAGSGVSNVFVAYRTARPLRWWPLQRAANHLLRRHPALRLRFPTVGGVPVRHLTAGADAEISVDTVATAQETMNADLQSYAHTPFDIARDLPLRVGHFMIGGGDSVLCLVVHHIVSDLASIEILVEELGRLYDEIAERGGPPAELEAEVPMLAEPAPSPEAVAYWRERLAGLKPEAMALPGARPSPARPTFAGGTVSAHLSADAVAAMRQLRQELRTTDNIVLLSAYLLTLLRHGAGPDLVVGVPVGGRRRAEAGQVGFGVRTLPVRVRADAEAGFRDLVLEAGGAFLSGAEHADVSVEVMLTEVGHHSGDWRVPVFRHMFNYRPWAEDKITICGEVPEPVPLGSDRSRLDLDLIAVPQEDGVWIRAAFSAEVHDEADIAALVARMDLLLRQAAVDPDRPIGRLDLCTDADRAVMDAANATGRDWEGGAGVLEQIAARAAERPQAPAVIDGSEVIDYGELMGRAAALRDRLRTLGVGRGDVIGLGLGRGAGMAAAVLGVWAVGACYLPLDAHQPGHRLRQLLDDADARLVVASGPVAWAGDREVVVPPGEPAAWGETTRLDPDTPAYVIYTSGSTGRPKGVIVTHRNLLNLVQDFTERLGVDASHAVLWSTTVAFDISALELFLPLCNGGRLVVADDQAQARPRSLLDLVTAHDVSVVQATPTVWRLAVGEVAGELGGRQVLCGGEPLPAALARRLIDRDCRLFNVYGPTETTIWSTAAEIDRPPADPVTIGRPIANTQVFVLDPLGQELPPGLPGELCIAGSGVSAGYLRRPELTAERFGEHRRFGRFYRTGDLARFRPDGTLEMLGRTDRQVKLRGHRIELGEVESVLYEHGRVRAAAVIVSGDPQAGGRLLAFVQTESPADPSGDTSGLREELWEHARSRLPGAAVPSGIVFVDGFPTTPSNKIDYRALAKAASADEPMPGAAPPPVSGGDAGLSRRLVELWQQILRRPRLGPGDNFFLSGGHSLLAIQLVTRIEETTGRALPVGAVFEHPTPAQLAAHLSATAVSP